MRLTEPRSGGIEARLRPDVQPRRKLGAATGTEQVRHLLRAPNGYADVGRQFAYALEHTGFRTDITPTRLRRLLAHAEELVQRAALAQARATAAARARMPYDSEVWKSIMTAWRMVVAAMPAHPELEQPFAFMQAYMAIPRSAASAPNPAEPPAPPAPAA